MKSKFLAIIGVCVTGILVVGGMWLGHGRQNLTKDKVRVEKKVVDEIFGTETTTVEFQNAFFLGLDIAGPALAVCGAGIVLSVYMLRKNK